ncbi:hypothetical protein ACJX0J_022772, partial [Zea mays]
LTIIPPHTGMLALSRMNQSKHVDFRIADLAPHVFSLIIGVLPDSTTFIVVLTIFAFNEAVVLILRRLGTSKKNYPIFMMITQCRSHTVLYSTCKNSLMLIEAFLNFFFPYLVVQMVVAASPTHYVETQTCDILFSNFLTPDTIKYIRLMEILFCNLVIGLRMASLDRLVCTLLRLGLLSILDANEV